MQAGRLDLVVNEEVRGSYWRRRGAIAAFQGTFIVALEGGGLLTSRDGVDWTRVASVDASSVVAGRSGLLAWGGDSGSWWSSDDGQTWRAIQPAQAFGTNALAAWGDGFMAVGESGLMGESTGAIWITETGAQWQPVDIGEDLGPDGGWDSGWGLRDIVVGASRLAVLGTRFEQTESQVWVSDDGVDWQRAPRFHQNWEGYYIEHLGGGDHVFALPYSEDGAPVAPLELAAGRWVKRSPDAFRSRHEEMGVIIDALAQTPGGYVAVGSDGDEAALWVSANGRDWTRVEVTSHGVSAMQDLAATDSQIVIVGRSGATYEELQQAFWLTPPTLP